MLRPGAKGQRRPDQGVIDEDGVTKVQCRPKRPIIVARRRSTTRRGSSASPRGSLALPANGYRRNGRSARLAKPLRRTEWERR